MNIARYETVGLLHCSVHCELRDSSTHLSGGDFSPNGFSVTSCPDVSGCHSYPPGAICDPIVFLSHISIVIESR